jgi:hypothetical protein
MHGDDGQGLHRHAAEAHCCQHALMLAAGAGCSFAALQLTQAEAVDMSYKVAAVTCSVSLNKRQWARKPAWGSSIQFPGVSR